jgi:hypothetical protein
VLTHSPIGAYLVWRPPRAGIGGSFHQRLDDAHQVAVFSEVHELILALHL